MFKRLIEWFRIHRRYKDLEKSYDARLMLNRRLSQQNADLKAQLQKRKEPRAEAPMTDKMQRHINMICDAHSLQKARSHIALMRREVTIRKLALKLPSQEFIAVQAEVNAMTDEQVLAYKKPKLQIPTSNSN